METSKIKSRNHLLLTGSDGFFPNVFCITPTPCSVTGRALKDGGVLHGLSSGCHKKTPFSYSSGGWEVQEQGTIMVKFWSHQNMKAWFIADAFQLRPNMAEGARDLFGAFFIRQ